MLIPAREDREATGEAGSGGAPLSGRCPQPSAVCLPPRNQPSELGQRARRSTRGAAACARRPRVKEEARPRSAERRGGPD